MEKLRLLTNHIMKAALLGCFLFLYSLDSIGQTRFNVRDAMTYNYAVFMGVNEIDNRYSVIGGGLLETDSINGFSMFNAFYSENGQFLETSNYIKNQGLFLINNDPASVYLNSEMKYCVMGSTYGESTDSEVGFIASFDELGDTIKVIEFTSPYMELFDVEFDFNKPQEIIHSTNADNSFFVSSNIGNPETTGTDCYIQRMTPEGETLWQYIYATNANPDACYAMLPTENGGVLGIIHQFGVVDRLFVILNDSGTVISENYSEVEGIIRDVIWAEDSFIIGVGGVQSSDNYLTGKIFKSNTSGEIIWDTIIGLGQEQSFQNQFYKVVHSADGAYVAGGTKKEYLPEEDITPATGNTRSQGWLVKVDDDGEVIWERKYHYIDSPQDDHTLNDLKATSDGGYIFCGESTDYDTDLEFTEAPRQQGWLVKVDEYGCLVEGCQLSDNINVIEKQGSTEYFKAGPNPASQFLNIYQSQNTFNSAIYQLYDLQGKLLESFPAMSKGTTMMVDVSKYKSGIYSLNLLQGNQLLQSEKIIVRGS